MHFKTFFFFWLDGAFIPHIPLKLSMNPDLSPLILSGTWYFINSPQMQSTEAYLLLFFFFLCVCSFRHSGMDWQDTLFLIRQMG